MFRFSAEFRIAVRVIDLAPDSRSFFVRGDSDTTTFTPYPELNACVFDFWFQRLSLFHLALPAPFESARRPHWCSPPDVRMSPACTSTQVFRPKGPELFHFRHCGRRQTKWEGGSAGSERPDTTVCRPWAMKEHSQNYSLLVLSASVRRFGSAFLSRFRRTRRLIRPSNVLRR